MSYVIYEMYFEYTSNTRTTRYASENSAFRKKKKLIYF